MFKTLIVVISILVQAALSADVIVLFGPPGSGKGTFSQYAQQHGYEHVSAGDVIRQEIKKKSALGEILEPILKRGDFIDSDLMLRLLTQKTAKFVQRGQPFIIDGYGRTSEDINKLANYLHKINIETTLLILDASDDVCTQRISTRLVCTECDYVANKTMGLDCDAACPCCNRGLLKLRMNDSIEVTTKRLKHYRDTTRGLCQHLDVDRRIELSTEMSLEECYQNYSRIIRRLALQ